jgi:hypothetical protein
VVKYTLISTNPKGQYTYDYFDLKGLEIDSFDAAQGASAQLPAARASRSRKRARSRWCTGNSTTDGSPSQLMRPYDCICNGRQASRLDHFCEHTNSLELFGLRP